jgi:hypothetical protein
LVLAGWELAPVSVEVGQQLLLITPKPEAGGDILWRTFSDPEAEGVINLEFRNLFGTRDKLSISIKEELTAEKLRALTAGFKLVELTLPDEHEEQSSGLAVRPVPILRPAARKDDGAEAAPRLEAIDSHETRFEYQGSNLIFDRETAAKQVEFCGCRDDDKAPSEFKEALVFLAGAEAPRNATRDIYCVRVGAGDEAEEQLRASAGLFREGDLRRHFSIGNFTRERFRPWLKVRGNGAVEFPGGQEDDDKHGLFTMLEVKGTLQLPAIKPDPRDPVFKRLLVLSFFSGVLSKSGGALVVELTVNRSRLIETDQPWFYELNLRNRGFIDTLKDAEFQESFDGGSPHPVIKQVKEILPQSNQLVKIEHVPGDLLDPDAESLTIQMRVTMQSGTRKVAAITNPFTIEIAQSPSANLDNIPDSIPAGISFPLRISNRDERALDVGPVVVVGVGDNPQFGQTVTDAPLHLTGNEEHETNSVLVGPAASGNRKLTVRFVYELFGGDESAFLQSKDVTIVRALTASAETSALHPDAPWTYDLTLTNTSNNQVKLNSFDVRAFEKGIATPPDFTTFKPKKKILDKLAAHSQPGLAGVALPAGAVVVIEVRMNFKWLETEWTEVLDKIEKTIPEV